MADSWSASYIPKPSMRKDISDSISTKHPNSLVGVRQCVEDVRCLTHLMLRLELGGRGGHHV